jgi:AcrR family transcriptional regulator
MSRLPASKRREQLLDCAADLFSKYGYARATTAQLAKAAGVTEPIIYRHFESKRDLFVALIERTGRETIEAWEKHLADASDSAERLRRLIGDNPMVTERGRSAYRVILQAISEVEDPVIHDSLRNHIKSLHAFLVEELDAAQSEHKVTARFSAEILAWILIHIGLGYGVLAAMNIPGQGVDQQGVHIRDVTARLLVGRPGGGDNNKND